MGNRVVLLLCLVVALSAVPGWAQVDRVSPVDARLMAVAGEALLVCAYEDFQKCTENRVAGSIDRATLERVEKAIRPDFTLVFY